MKKSLLLSIVTTVVALTGFSQQLPVGTCGIVNVYDAAGNRTKRTYFCNNGGAYPTKVVKPNEVKEAVEFQPVDALYPNPTTGKFAITFSTKLEGADVLLKDVNGKVVQQVKGNGYQLYFDLSGLAAGVYFVWIKDGENIITKKVVKQ